MASYSETLRIQNLVREQADEARRAAVEASRAAVPGAASADGGAVADVLEDPPSEGETVATPRSLHARGVRRRLASPHSDQIYNDALIGFITGAFDRKNITATNAGLNASITAQAVVFATEFDAVLFSMFGSFTPTADQSNYFRDIIASVVSEQYGTGSAASSFDAIIVAILELSITFLSSLEPITPPSTSGPWQETPVGGPNGIISPIDAGASVEGGMATVAGGLQRAFAWGAGSDVTVNDAAAFGGGVASALYAFAVGQNTVDSLFSTATGESSVAFGGAQASGDRSLAVGGLSTAEGNDSIALGAVANAATLSDVALGEGQATGGNSLAANGSAASASLAASFNMATAEGEQSLAGNQGNAVTLNDAAFNSATASGGDSFGVNTGNATGVGAFSANASTAAGTNSAAFGESSAANSEGSFVTGGGIANEFGQVAMGPLTPTFALGQWYGPTPSCYIAIGDDSDNTTIQISPTSLGFFGTAPAIQQEADNATAGIAYTSVEQGMINQMFTALVAYGLLFPVS